MRRVVGKRVLQAIPIMLGVSFLTFGLLNLLPGDTAQAILGTSATPQALRKLRQQLGLNQPFFERYFVWLGHLLTGHLGNSVLTGQSVISILAIRMPVTVELVICSTLLALLAAIPVGLLAAYRPRSIVDRLNIFVSMAGLSLPSFVVGLLLILLVAVHWRLLPASGFVPLSQSIGGNVKSMILPSLTMSFGIFCGYTRILRADLVDQMRSQDYVMVARGKGLSRWHVLVHHALRNSCFPIITLIGLHFATMLGGAVIVETIFALPGIGQEALAAVQDKDIAVLQVIVVLAAAAVVTATLLTDLVYSVVDPRVRHGHDGR